MTIQNQAEKDAKPLSIPNDNNALKAAAPSEIERVLTDEELAAVAGGILFPVFAQVEKPTRG